MANEEQLRILKEEGVEAWKEWRKVNPNVEIDLREADLKCVKLERVNLWKANLSGANLSGANLLGANLVVANLSGANLLGANLEETDLSGANLEETNLSGANLWKANLWKANLWKANLSGANLLGANLLEANLEETNLSGANLEETDQSEVMIGSSGRIPIIVTSGDIRQEEIRRKQEQEEIRRKQEQEKRYESLYDKFSSDLEEIFELSLLHPRRLAKGLSSTITVQIYLPYKRYEVTYIIERLQQLESSELFENIYPTALVPGQTVIVRLSSPAINFSKEVRKKLRGQYINRVTFTAQPDNKCLPGRQAAVLSIIDCKTNEEYESIPCFLRIDDFAFDHVSKPILYNILSGVTGIGSLALFRLSFLEKLDATFGILVGLVGVVLALVFAVRPIFLYKQRISQEAINILASRVNRPIIVEAKAVAENRSINTGGGDYRENNLQGDSRYIETRDSSTYYENYTEPQKQTLAQAAQEIQNLLKQLEQTNPTATVEQQEAFVNAAIPPTLKQRVIGALMAGGETAIEEFLDNPYVNVGKAIVKGWINPE